MYQIDMEYRLLGTLVSLEAGAFYVPEPQYVHNEVEY